MTDTVYVHVRATAVFGIGFLIVGFFLWRLRRELPGIARAGAVLLVLLVRRWPSARSSTATRCHGGSS